MGSVKESKKLWLDLNVNNLDSVKHEYSRDFYRSYYSLLNSGKTNFSENYSYFNNISLYYSNFLNLIYRRVLALQDVKSSFKIVNVLYNFLSRKNFARNFIPNFNLFFFENVYNFILNLVKDNIGGPNRNSIKYFPFVFTLFIFVIMCNLIGLIPYSSTITSYLIVTFALAVMVLVGVNIVAARAHGIKYFGHFLPAGCPFSLYFIIIPIEFISYIFRVVSLSVRLFANMMAGHTLLAVLAGFGWTMATSSVILFLIHPGPVLVVFVLVFLETAVALIQAYVFTILTCMYLDEATTMH
jgi:ATP synthase subunit 6